MMTSDYNFFFFWKLFRRHYLMLLCSGIIGMIFACIYTVNFIKPVYASSKIIYIGRMDWGLSDSAENNRVHISDQQAMIFRREAVFRELTLGQALINDYKLLMETDLVKNQVAELIHKKHPGIKYNVKIKTPPNSRILQLTVSSTNQKLVREITEDIANVFIKEIKNIIEVNNSKIVDAASPPEQVSPNCVINALIGFAAGFIIVFLFVFLRTIIDTRIYTYEDLQEAVRSDILGTIPKIKELSSLHDGERGPEQNRIVALRSGTDDKWNIGEAFRSLRTNLQCSDIRSNVCKVFSVTSSSPHEGKTFNAANIGVSFAEIDRRTLVINCDLHKPSFTWTFGVQKETGIVDVLAGNVKFEDAVVRKMYGLPLDVLFCGTIPATPSRLLLSEEFKKFIEERKQEYDYIIIDTPPVIGVADTAVIGAVTDGTILIVQSGRTRRETLRHAFQILRQAKINVLGVVFNHFSYSKGQGYGYDYGYDPEPKKTLMQKFRNIFDVHSRHHDSSSK